MNKRWFFGNLCLGEIALERLNKTPLRKWTGAVDRHCGYFHLIGSQFFQTSQLKMSAIAWCGFGFASRFHFTITNLIASNWSVLFFLGRGLPSND